MMSTTYALSYTHNDEYYALTYTHNDENYALSYPP